MAYSLLIIIFLLCLTASSAAAQSRYKLSPGPDLWFNSVDGLRMGLRLKGQMVGTFGDGPHRLDMGLWLGSKLPHDPVSYYVSLTEPLPAWSDFGSEAAVEGISSMREGIHFHGLNARKRWQRGFNEKEYESLQLTGLYRQRFDERYAPFPQLWQGRPVYEISASGHFRRETTALGPYHLKARITSGWLAERVRFSQLEIEQQANTKLGAGFTFGHRLFLGLSSDGTPVESRYRLGGGNALDAIGSGITRSRGTIPQAWMNEGWVAIAGGPNLRGYHRGEVIDLLNGQAITHASVAGFNLELDFPNPMDWVLRKIPLVGGLVRSKWGPFYDGGGAISGDQTRFLSDAGLGVTLGLDLPEYLGRDGSVAFRFDVPFWLSHPGDGHPNWKYRPLFGIWSVINL